MRSDYDHNLLNCLQDFVILAEMIDDVLVEQKDFFDDNADINEHAFVAHFHQRTLRYAESIVFLTSHGFLHESVVIARVILEGMFLFGAYLEDRALSHYWHLYAVHEDYHKEFRRADERSATKLMDDYKKRFGAVIEEAEAEFSTLSKKKGKHVMFDKKQRWYKQSNIFSLVEKKTDFKGLYKVLYRDFSQPIHWTITGMLDGDTHINPGLVVAFDTLFLMSKEADKKYDLGFDAKLKEVYRTMEEIVSSVFSKSRT
jgi:Family of unknown function (DUF5677)